MRKLLLAFSSLGRDEKRYWVPILLGIGASICFLGVSLIGTFGLSTWAGWLDIAFGQVMVWWGVAWSKKPERKEQLVSPDVITEVAGERRSVNHKDVRHEILADRQEPYYLGESVGFKVRLTNLLDESCTREFYYIIQLPDGMNLHRPLYPVHFKPREDKVIPLGDPVFLAFLGIFRLIIVTGEAESLLIREGKIPVQMTFQALVAGYSRDREGHQLRIQMVSLTGWIRGLTLLLIVLTAALVGLSILVWLND